MEDNRNADALDILDGSISVATRAIKAAIEAERAAQQAKGIKGTGKNVRDVARAISAALDPLLDDAVPRAFAYAGDIASASPVFQRRLIDLIEDAQRHLDVIAVFEHGVNGASESYMASVRKLLDGDRARVRGAIAVLRGGPIPVAVGSPPPPTPAAVVSRAGRKAGQFTYLSDAGIIERAIAICDGEGLPLARAIARLLPEIEPVHLSDDSKKRRIRDKVLETRPDLRSN